MIANGNTALLSNDHAHGLYDRLRLRRRTQGFYEDAAVARVFAHGDFDRAQSVFEYGCGTGSFAEDWLGYYAVEDAAYTGCDTSEAMVEESRRRLARFGGKATVRIGTAEPRVPYAQASFDRFVSTYVLDLLPPEDITRLLQEAHRVLRPGGLLCLAAVTHGAGPLTGLMSAAWSAVHARAPERVGGCRPIDLRNHVGADRWQILHTETVSTYLVPSQVLVATPRH